MLVPEYFDGKEQRMMELYQQLSEFILKEAARFLIAAGKITPTADRLLQRLRLMGETQAEIEKKLQVLTGLSRKELRAILQDAVLTSWEADAAPFREIGINLPDPLKNPAVIRIMDAQYKRSQGELQNLTRTTMKQSYVDLMNMLDEADMQVAAGAQSYSAAISDILDRYARRGVYVDYPTGARRTLEAAVMCCVRTSMGQMAGQLTMEFVKEAGTNLVIVSAHTGARFTDKDEPANHMGWQGLPYYVSDADLARLTEVKEKIESGGEKAGGSQNTGNYPDFVKTTGYGEPDALGLCGYNCRHSFGAWDPRIGNPWRDKDGNLIDGAGNRIDSEESKQKYKDSQRLRAIERNIRAIKRQLVAKEQLMQGASKEELERLQPEYDKLAYELTRENKKYNDFAKEHDLAPQYGRTKLADFGREQTKAANAGARRYANIQEKESELHTENPSPEMFRKGKTHRKIEDGVEIIDQTTYNKLIEPVLKNGGKVYRGTEEIEQHLKVNNASASTIGDVILFRKNVTVSDVLEETFHFEQNLKKRNADKPLKEQIILNEIEAKEYVLSCQKKYHISEIEAEQTKNQLESYKKELGEYYENQK